MTTATKAPHGLEFDCEHWDSACDNMPQDYLDAVMAQIERYQPIRPRNWYRLLSGELLTDDEHRRYVKTFEKPNREPIYTLERFRREVLPDAVD
ncbi:MAG: hypothetical protein IJ774_13860 [Selenomonadaceae bacterium]|nr:hypothetical protein [Selenomonadaceae bacterium]